MTIDKGQELGGVVLGTNTAYWKKRCTCLRVLLVFAAGQPVTTRPTQQNSRVLLILFGVGLEFLWGNNWANCHHIDLYNINLPTVVSNK